MTAKRAATPRGEARRNAILEAAVALLAGEGRGAFSMRRVAEAAGISLGNLQYHFATEAALLEALLDDVLRRSIEHIEQRFGPAGCGADLAARLDGILALHDDRRLCRLFFELWALGAHDRRARAALARFYGRYVDRIALELAAPREVTETDRARARSVVALLEGAALFAAGFAGPLPPSAQRDFRDAVLRVALI